MQLFSVTSTALGFLHRTETANSPLETGWGESAAVLGKELPEAQEGNGRNLPSFHPPSQLKSGAKMPKSHRDVLRCGCTVPGKCSAFPLPSQSQAQPAALRNAPKILQGLSQSLPLGAELLSKFLTHLSWPSSHLCL